LKFFKEGFPAYCTICNSWFNTTGARSIKTSSTFCWFVKRILYKHRNGGKSSARR